jgi:RNA polymerase sigma-70 factor, ECF subfamily
MSSDVSDDVGRIPDPRTSTQRSADATLVDLLRGGDADAFSQLVRSWSPMMLHLARSYVSTDASAQEVVQETWLAMIRGLHRFEARSSLRTWVLAILGNLGRTRGVREARAVPWSSLGPDDMAGSGVDRARFRGRDEQWPGHWTPVGNPNPWQPGPEDETVAAQVRDELSTALARLPLRQRTVIGLRNIHGLSADEVCSLLGISPGNQRVLLHRARSRLRGQLDLYYSTLETGLNQ